MHLLLALLATAATPSLAQKCVPELVSGAIGEGQSMFHGLSPDGREIAIGWESGTGDTVRRGAFILDLRTGKRTDLPHLNNAPSFSPDGHYLVAANYSGDPNLQTEVVELDRRTGTTRTYASDPATEWLASYSHDGKWILFNSMRTGASDRAVAAQRYMGEYAHASRAYVTEHPLKSALIAAAIGAAVAGLVLAMRHRRDSDNYF